MQALACSFSLLGLSAQHCLLLGMQSLQPLHLSCCLATLHHVTTLSQKCAWADKRKQTKTTQNVCLRRGFCKSSALPPSQHLSNMALTWQAYKRVRQCSTTAVPCKAVRVNKKPSGTVWVSTICLQAIPQSRCTGLFVGFRNNTMQWQGVCADLASELHDFLLTLLAPVGKVTGGLLHLPHQTHLQCMPAFVSACF